jgi:hypothetical protein
MGPKQQKKTFTVVAKIDGTCQKIPLTVTQTNGKWHLPSNLRSNIHTDSIYHGLPKWSKLLISLLYGEPTYGLNPGIWNLIHSLKIAAFSIPSFATPDRYSTMLLLNDLILRKDNSAVVGCYLYSIWRRWWNIQFGNSPYLSAVNCSLMQISISPSRLISNIDRKNSWARFYSILPAQFYRLFLWLFTILSFMAFCNQFCTWHYERKTNNHSWFMVIHCSSRYSCFGHFGLPQTVTVTVPPYSKLYLIVGLDSQ